MVEPGRRFGPYELVALIGAGGMGEVYRARDARLGRDVAIKIIASDGLASPDRFRRFEQEARAVAALSDPHILSIYDLGMQDGTVYAAFELLEGETLHERLDRGAPAPRKAVEWAIQICRGLAAAHARGIVHRDLKPANLFLTREGHVKILDFGLAKLREPEGSEGPDTPTRTATQPGAAAGTTGYMSPEQVRGQPADARSDLFAVGATLYEMLTGRAAFPGATTADRQLAVLSRDPPEIEGPGEPVSPALARIAHRCLEKDPEERFQSAKDLAFALEALGSASRSGTQPPPEALRPRRRWLISAALLGTALLAAGAGVGLRLGRALGDAALPRIQQITFRLGCVDRARFTSDGKTVVYSAFWDGKPPEIFTTRLESRESRSLGLPPASLLAVSSRGELAILLVPEGSRQANPGAGTLARVSLSGGEPKRVLDGVARAEWSPDGRELAVLRQLDGAFQIEYPIGNAIYRRPWDSAFRISPSGDKIAVVDDGLRVLDRSGKEIAKPPVPSSTAGVAWDGDDALWALAGESQINRTIWHATLDGKAREVYRALGTMGSLHDASPDGRLLVHHGFERFGVKAKPPGETSEREVGVFNWTGVVGFLDDGSKALLSDVSFGPTSAVYLRPTDGREPVTVGEGYGLALSPDGAWALIGSPPGRLPLTLVPTGPGEPRRLQTEGFEQVRHAWFVDNRRLVVLAVQGGQPARCFLFDTEDGARQPITPAGTFAVPGSYAADKVLGWTFGTGELAWISLAGGQPTRLPGRLDLPGHPIRVSADRRSIFVGDGRVPRKVERMDLATGKRTPWKTLMPEESAGVVMIEFAFITPDGQAYAYTYGRFLQDLFVVDGLRAADRSSSWGID